MASHAVFFKHARHDADQAREFHPRSSEIFLIMSLLALQRMSIPAALEEYAFLVWLMLHRPSWFFENTLEKSVPPESVKVLRHLKKDEFFEGLRSHFPKR